MHRLCFPTGDMNVRGKFVYCQTKLSAMHRLRHLTAGTLAPIKQKRRKFTNLTQQIEF